jgi:hypothetical protein
VLARPNTTIIAVTDDAGGFGDGAAAAEFVVDAVRAGVECDVNHDDAFYWRDVLIRADRALAAEAQGESTCLVVALLDDAIAGASIGDSQAWLFAVLTRTD